MATPIRICILHEFGTFEILAAFGYNPNFFIPKIGSDWKGWRCISFCINWSSWLEPKSFKNDPFCITHHIEFQLLTCCEASFFSSLTVGDVCLFCVWSNSFTCYHHFSQTFRGIHFFIWYMYVPSFTDFSLGTFTTFINSNVCLNKRQRLSD